MWTRPGYTPERPTPPQEQGTRLLTLPRPNDAELRVNLDEFNGHNYISLRIWEPGRDGSGMWPTKKGVTVRLGECHTLARVLTETAAGELGRQQGRAGQGGDQGEPARGFSGGGPGETTYVPRGRPVRPPWDAQQLAPSGPKGNAKEFDECT